MTKIVDLLKTVRMGCSEVRFFKGLHSPDQIRFDCGQREKCVNLQAVNREQHLSYEKDRNKITNTSRIQVAHHTGYEEQQTSIWCWDGQAFVALTGESRGGHQQTSSSCDEAGVSWACSLLD